MSEKLRKLHRAATADMMGNLLAHELAVVVLRLGWDRLGVERTQAEVAEILQVSQGYVSTLEASAMSRLEDLAQQFL